MALGLPLLCLALALTPGPGPVVVHRSEARFVRTRAPCALGPIRRDEGRDGAIGGAVLGGLIAGPFGALWGASLGSSIGSNRREQREREEQLTQLGLNRQTRLLAQQLTEQLAEAESGVAICMDAERSQLRLVEQLRARASDIYAAAEKKLRDGDENAARDLLVERKAMLERLEEAEKVLGEAVSRTEAMKRSVDVLSSRAQELEASFKSAIASRAAASGARAANEYASDAALAPEDPLLAKFRELEGR